MSVQNIIPTKSAGCNARSQRSQNTHPGFLKSATYKHVILLEDTIYTYLNPGLKGPMPFSFLNSFYLMSWTSILLSDPCSISVWNFPFPWVSSSSGLLTSVSPPPHLLCLLITSLKPQSLPYLRHHRKSISLPCSADSFDISSNLSEHLPHLTI